MLDLEEEKDVLAKYNAAWADSLLGLKKWSEKKDKMIELNNDINTPKILPNTNISAVMTVLSKLVNDSNMNVYDEVVKAVGYLGVGLKKHFEEEAKTIIGPIILKIKKRPNIIQNVSDT